MSRQLEHVVGAAALLGCGGTLEFSRKLPRLCEPALTVAGTGGDIGSRTHHFVPEIIGDVVETIITGELIAPGCADHLRDMRVDVEPAQLIAARRERIEESLLGKAISGVGPTALIRGSGEIVEY